MNNFTVEQLVQDVLINSNCAATSNYSSFTGTAQGVNGIGYFNNNASGFEYREGIVLSTGNAVDSEGPNVNIRNTNPAQWAGDADLSLITGRQELFNASFLQFDFIPRANSLSFNFLFASEEYDEGFQCNFSDVFAFILTGPDGISRNLALLPNTDIPVSVTSIRPGVPDSCPEENIEFFEGINGNNSPISQHGQTVSLTARSLVVPNETYTIKLVIADNRDPDFDSAVYLEAGSFSIDVSLGEDRTVSDGNPLCLGEIFELDATSQGAIGYNWYQDEVELLAAEDQPTLMVTDSGQYRVEVIFSADCFANGDIALEFIETPVIAEEPLDLVGCDLDGDGIYIFDFSENTDRIMGAQSPDTYMVRYYGSLADAENSENELENTTDYRANRPSETIYARISSGDSCNEITSFELRIQTLTRIPELPPRYALCLNDDGTVQEPFPVLAIEEIDPDYTFTWYRDVVGPGNAIPGATQSFYVATQAGTYIAVLQHITFGCSLSLSTEVFPSGPPEDFEVNVISELFADSNTIEIEIDGINDFSYSLDDEPFVASNRFAGVGPGAHTAHVMDNNGCGITSKDFFIIGFPKFFTPNNDGSNDMWTIAGLSDIDQAQVSIYDRQGRLLFQFFEDPGWNGSKNGRRLPAADYWFNISFLEEGQPREFKGHFALKR